MSTPIKKTKATKREPPQEHKVAELETTPSGITIISPVGDVVLVVQRDATAQETCKYRVQSSRLKDASTYFMRLLQSDFQEGTDVALRHAHLKTKYTDLDASVPADELPQVKIVDVGRIAATVKSISQLMADFLCALHARDMSTVTPPLANLANLCIVADRFDCIATWRAYCKTHKMIAALDARSTTKSAATWTEERVRQRLLVAIFLDNASWVYQASLRLLHRGWVGHDPEEDAALWWDLPMGIEDELLFRRDCILETTQSIQTYFLTQYTSRERQCKLGYDSSAECDMFQLGQTIKFFKRINTLSLQGTIFATSDLPEPYEGDILDLVDSFKQAPEYQVDKNHHHCGIRTRILPLIDILVLALGEVGICWWCWQECRHDYAWSKVKRPLIWKKDSVGASMHQHYQTRQTQSHLFKHLDTRDLFMANERLWAG
ncbi:hypothetical protein E4T42_03476 [Aureobasidium subglaciale]|uniref:BTB domain-containing protein n=1 Tax=Aureobasidium subglaciale (strain EXF-2481) TaxID=1043005 RepID=A0A074YCS0_AURSE|nr:uncharacterized protein AUEXF2481DRAFT_30914 [Aureobasidium subglaciale EXF-2481]KAI5208783.1 hypothetical protein E4T38_02672 [Aureobasidium subglaciale]KAI5227655.1 hypothetical protein E4T40_02503 [Aureobasidium subglaciale]KAI5230986.1 hypothetical protein E4T41_02671 [Aureobasidium subglaciale]KAI5252454.1 hypothetical protein E4T42_03476 [Aureobasidium subglaciale]KAI5265129.1 hypothetical protein E4T46_02449 [Aureobasidium subglaciale]